MIGHVRGTRLTLAALLMIGGAMLAPFALAQGGDPGAPPAHGEEVAAETEGFSEALRVMGLGIAAAITMAVAALATAKVQAAVGSGGTGALAEKPDLFGSILILIALPETIVILGFVMAYLLFSKI